MNSCPWRGGRGGGVGAVGLKEDGNLQTGGELGRVRVLSFKSTAVGESVWTPHAFVIMLHYGALIKSPSAFSCSYILLQSSQSPSTQMRPSACATMDLHDQAGQN